MLEEPLSYAQKGVGDQGTRISIVWQKSQAKVMGKYDQEQQKAQITRMEQN